MRGDERAVLLKRGFSYTWKTERLLIWLSLTCICSQIHHNSILPRCFRIKHNNQYLISLHCSLRIEFNACSLKCVTVVRTRQALAYSILINRSKCSCWNCLLCSFHLHTTEHANASWTNDSWAQPPKVPQAGKHIWWGPVYETCWTHLFTCSCHRFSYAKWTSSSFILSDDVILRQVWAGKAGWLLNDETISWEYFGEALQFQHDSSVDWPSISVLNS